jgi:SAM-dependent methyltransferase
MVPSTVLLSRSAVFVTISRAVDAVVRPFVGLFTSQPIPPLRYLVRTGVANNILAPHYEYLRTSHPLWLYFFGRGLATLDSRIVEIGSGVGATAVALRGFHYAGERFRGIYHGFDVDREMVQWCQTNFPPDRFKFTLLDMHSTIYNPSGSIATKPRLSCEDNSVDLIYSFSLFTHHLEQDIHHYLSESSRVLKTGGAMSMSFFCVDDLEQMQLLGGRWTFRHRLGNAYVESRSFPESAVAYGKEWMLEVARSYGFSDIRIIPGTQSLLQGIKKP